MVPILLAVALGVSSAPVVAHADAALLRSLRTDRPGIRLWTTQDEVYRRGERVRIYFRTERDAYVTIIRADTDGRLRVLYPREPWDENHVRGGATYGVNGAQRGDAFVVDDDPGVGYVFGIASSDPFLYDRIVNGDRWDVRAAYERIHGDPYSSLMDAVTGLMPEGYVDYDTHLLPYYVEQRYDYPRFVCYDCHGWVGYSSWNPYRTTCRSFSLFVYTDPYYFYPSYWYPTRYYGGTRVVYVRPRDRGYQGRYVFKNREPSQPGIVYRRRTADAAGNAPADRGVRASDIGGVGSAGVPGMPGRRTVGTVGSSGDPQTPIPIIRGTTGGRRAVVDPGITPPARSGTPAESSTSGRRGVTGSGASPTTGEQPAAPGRRPEERPQPGAVPIARPPADRPTGPTPRSDPKAGSGSTGRRTAPSEPTERPQAQPQSRSSRPSSPPARSEPQARPSSRPSSPPARSAPQARPASRPSSAPARSAPRSAPSRRRPDG